MYRVLVVTGERETERHLNPSKREPVNTDAGHSAACVERNESGRRTLSNSANGNLDDIRTLKRSARVYRARGPVNLCLYDDERRRPARRWDGQWHGASAPSVALEHRRRDARLADAPPLAVTGLVLREAETNAGFATFSRNRSRTARFRGAPFKKSSFFSGKSEVSKGVSESASRASSDRIGCYVRETRKKGRAPRNDGLRPPQ